MKPKTLTRSALVIDCETIDLAAIAMHLQLKGRLEDSRWVFQAADRLTHRNADSHTEYWSNLLNRHRDGKNALMAMQHKFTIVIQSQTIELSDQSIQSLAGHRVGLRIETLESNL